jgi:transposase InsO family protein
LASDNALAEATNSLHKSELIRGPGQGPWKCVDDVELATLAWVRGWYKTAPSHGYCKDVPTAEFDGAHAVQQTDQQMVGIQ